MNFGRRAGTHFTCKHNLEDEKPGHNASPHTHLLTQHCACIYVSHCLSTGMYVYWSVCSLEHIMGDRGVTR